MSLKQRVMLTTAVAVLIAAAVVGVMAYLLVERQLLATIDNTLQVSAAEAKVGPQNQDAPPLPPDVPVDVALARVDPPTWNYHVVRLAGTSSAPLPFPDLTADQVHAATDGPITVEAGGAYRIYVRVMDPNRGTALAVMSLNDYQRSLATLALSLAAVIGGVLLIVISVSWLVARRMFRPLDDIVRSAQQVSAGSTEQVDVNGRASEVRQLTDSLNEMIDNLSTSERALRSFISDTSHEIRTPLTVISGYIQKLEAAAKKGAPTDPEDLRRLSAEAARLERLVTQLLRLDKYTSGASTMTAVRLDEVMRDELSDLVSLGVDRFITFDLQPVTVEGDEDSLRQVFANLRQNLERHTPPGTYVEATLTSDGAHAIALIDDSGPGMSGSQTSAGFGLGIPIVEAVIATHRGSLDMSTSPLGGLRTRITLPLHGQARMN